MKQIIQKLKEVPDKIAKRYEDGEPETINKRGCPCQEDCCNNPRPRRLHYCDTSCDSLCKERNRRDCLTCEQHCYCNWNFD